MDRTGVTTMRTSTTQEKPYLLGHEEHELLRLSRQADFYAPLTAQALLLAGIEPGMRVLDAGCGAGDVSMLIARMLGPTGQVIAVDRADEAVAATRGRMERERLANVHCLQGELATIELDAPVDAVVGRLVLMHVADPVGVLRNLTAALSGPGIVLFQEMDISAARSEPPAPFVEQMVDLCRNAFTRLGVDVSPGLRLHDQFVAAGLPAPQLVSLGRIEAAPARQSVAQLTGVLTTLLPAIEATGLSTAAEMQLETLPERLSAELAATGSLIFTPPMITAWTCIG
jgi:SAM-dependent methyltransferase